MNLFHQLESLIKYPFIFAVAYALAFSLTPVMIWLAPKIGMVDVPDARRVHKRITPRGGGLAVIIAFHVSYLVFFGLLPGFTIQLNFDWWIAFLGASTILLVTGLIDDGIGLNPLVKLAGQTAAALVLVLGSGSGFNQLLGMELPYWMNVTLTLLWYLAFINAFNLIDGLDGLCSGLAMIGAIGLGVSYVILRRSADMLPTLALAGACLGFLRYNFHPAKIFLGDTGSMFLGLALASFALETGGKSTVVVTLGVAVLAAGVPLFDTLLAIWRRSVRKLVGGNEAGGVMGADKEHLHHRLLSSGLSQRKVVMLLYVGSSSLVFAGLLSLMAGSMALGVYLLILILALYVVVRHVAHIEIWDTGVAIARGIRTPKTRYLGTIVYVLWDIFAISAALAIAFKLVPVIELDQTIGTKEEWIRKFPYWIFPIFASLFFGKVYRRVWSKAGTQDFLALQLSILVGWIVLVAGLIFTLGGWDIQMLGRLTIFGGVLYALIVTSRSASQIVHTVMLTIARTKRDSSAVSIRVLVYGVSERSLLFLRRIEYIDAQHAAGFKVVGLLDDDLNLRKRLVKGHEVVGALDDLGYILQSQQVDRIMVTCELTEEHKEHLLEIAGKHGIMVTEWNVEQQVLLEEGTNAPQEDEPPNDDDEARV